MDAEEKKLQIKELEQIHLHKTGRLLEFAVEAGAILANVDQEKRQFLMKYARHLGIAFQIKDDLLDIEGNEAEIGKHVGSDTENGKNTYPSILTAAGAKEHLKNHFNKAIEALHQAGVEDGILVDLAHFIVERNH